MKYEGKQVTFRYVGLEGNKKKKIPSKTQLYRCFNSDGELLYIGISASILARVSGHKMMSGWFYDVSDITVEHFDTRQSALNAEREAIKSENPKYNVIHGEPEKLEDDNLVPVFHVVRAYTVDCGRRKTLDDIKLFVSEMDGKDEQEIIDIAKQKLEKRLYGDPWE